VPPLPKRRSSARRRIGVSHDQCIRHLALPTVLVRGRHRCERDLWFAEGDLAWKLCADDERVIIRVSNGEKDGGSEVFGGGDDIGDN
jgi:hypothetical protein